jgi:hypothetical protein
VVDEKTPTDLRSRMNLDPGEKAANVRQQPGEKIKAVSPEKMSHAMPPQCLQSRITEDNLQPAPGRWVFGKNCADIFPQGSKH